MLGKRFLAAFHIKPALFFFIDIIMRRQPFIKELAGGNLLVYYYLSGFEPCKLVEELVLRLFAHHIDQIKISGGNIAIGKLQHSACRIDGADIVVCPVGQHLLFYNGAGCYDPYDVPFNKPFCKRGILELLAYSHLIALFNKPVDIAVYRVIGHAAHGRALGHAAVPCGEHYFKLPRGCKRILKKHLIKIA